MKIDRYTCQELASTNIGKSYNGFTVVQNDISDTSRWSVWYVIVIEKDGKFYKNGYARGATEHQEEFPFDSQYTPEEVEWDEVFPVEKTITVYEAKKE